MVFGSLIIGYLFLGGAGAGLLVVLSVLEWYNIGKNPARYHKELLVRSWPFCLGILAFAALCLLVDLGRIDRVLTLFTNPSLSALSVGSYSLLLSILCAVAFGYIRVLRPGHAPRVLVSVLSVVGFTAGVVTAVYTGILLESLSSVLFWNSIFLPALFFLSALSTGIACLLLTASFVNTRASLFKTLRRLTRVDALLIILELLCLALYLASAYLNPATTATAQTFLFGDMSWLFWVGLVFCGLIVPFVLEARISVNNYSSQILWVALLVLIGGLILRFCIVDVSSYDVIQVTPPMVRGIVGL